MDCLRAKLQTALHEEVKFVGKVQQLETDKIDLEERVTQLLKEASVHCDIDAKLEESKRELFRLQQAMEEHEAAASQVGCNAYAAFMCFVDKQARTTHKKHFLK